MWKLFAFESGIQNIIIQFNTIVYKICAVLCVKTVTLMKMIYTELTKLQLIYGLLYSIADFSTWTKMAKTNIATFNMQYVYR